jgi:PleD family two-component response regulator
VAEFQAGDSADSLLGRCDQALYRAKADGRACVRIG